MGFRVSEFRIRRGLGFRGLAFWGYGYGVPDLL